MKCKAQDRERVKAKNERHERWTTESGAKPQRERARSKRAAKARRDLQQRGSRKNNYGGRSSSQRQKTIATEAIRAGDKSVAVKLVMNDVRIHEKIVITIWTLYNYVIFE